MFQIEDYRTVVSDEVLANVHRKARRLLGQRVIEVNSTFEGGGVVELLSSLVPLMHDAGVDADWRTIAGDPDFFNVTKQFHNALQGAPIRLTARKRERYEAINQRFATYAQLARDVVVVHDPQPLPLVRYLPKRQPWIWRCHIDLSAPDLVLWHYLKGFILRYDLVVVSHPSYMHDDLPVPQRVVMPAIDPLTLKNRPMDHTEVAQILGRHQIPLDKPLVTQISRFDPWKDPLGVLEMFERVHADCDCRLVLCGSSATDDPEGTTVLDEVRRRAKKRIAAGDVIVLTENNSLLVNALQRGSAVVVQKSLREGFGLTVTEAMWKGAPVVSTTVGGIPLQVTDGVDGFLVDPSDAAAMGERVVALLRDRDLATEIGHRAQETVRDHFLITRMLCDHLDVLQEVLG